MRILVIEDQLEKRTAICHALAQVDGIDVGAIEHATDATTARGALARERFDFVVLDIALPQRADLDVDASAGTLLLEEVLEQRVEYYKTPSHVVGMTAYEEIYEKMSGRFASRLWTLVFYDPASEAWSAALQTKAKNVLSSLRAEAGEIPDYETDVVVVTALGTPELDAVREIAWSWEQVNVAGDHTTYWKGLAKTKGGSKLIRAAAASRPGFSAAAALTGKMIQAFRPRMVAMVGIAAGVRNKVNLGDVVVADPCWDWGSGKLAIENGESVFQPAPYQVPLDVSSRERLVAIAADAPLLSQIRDRWRGEKPQTALNLHIGPFASGAAVVADGGTIARIVSQQHRQLLALDMEAYSVMYVTEEAPKPRPSSVVIKGIVDYADALKDDRWRYYAAYTSAEVLRVLIEEQS